TTAAQVRPLSEASAWLAWRYAAVGRETGWERMPIYSVGGRWALPSVERTDNSGARFLASSRSVAPLCVASRHSHINHAVRIPLLIGPAARLQVLPDRQQAAPCLQRDQSGAQDGQQPAWLDRQQADHHRRHQQRIAFDLGDRRQTQIDD